MAHTRPERGGDLAGTLQHLPQAAPAAPAVRFPARLGDSVRYLVGLTTPTVVSVGIWAASGRQGSFWPVWVMLASVAVGLRHFARGGRRRRALSTSNRGRPAEEPGLRPGGPRLPLSGISEPPEVT